MSGRSQNLIKKADDLSEEELTHILVHRKKYIQELRNLETKAKGYEKLSQQYSLKEDHTQEQYYSQKREELNFRMNNLKAILKKISNY